MPAGAVKVTSGNSIDTDSSIASSTVRVIASPTRSSVASGAHCCAAVSRGVAGTRALPRTPAGSWATKVSGSVRSANGGVGLAFSSATITVTSSGGTSKAPGRVAKIVSFRV